MNKTIFENNIKLRIALDFFSSAKKIKRYTSHLLHCQTLCFSKNNFLNLTKEK